MLTVFTSFSMGCTYILAQEYQFQTLGRIDTLQKPGHVKTNGQEFSNGFAPDIESELDEIIEPMAYRVRSRVPKADEQENNKAREKEEKKDFYDPGRSPPVEELP
jgi:hypothetical protein